MKILSITAQKPNSTGSGVYLTELVKEYAAEGHKQAVVAGVYEDDKVELPEGVSFYPVYFCKETGENTAGKIPYPITGMSDEMPYKSTRYCDVTPEMAEQFKKAFLGVIGKAVKELEPDLILCHHLYLLTAIVREAFPDHKIYGFCHNTDLRQMRKTDLEREYIREQIRNLDHIFVPQRAQEEGVREIYDVIPENITRLGMGYNNKIFRVMKNKPEDGITRIVFAGKIAEKKGVMSLIRSFDLFEYDTKRLQIFMAGSTGNEEEYRIIRELARRCPYKITFLGRLTQPELAKVYNECDIFTLPSFFEGIPLTVIEALACGDRVVMTDLPGVAEWLSEAAPEADIRYVSMPQMRNTDEAVPETLPAFEKRLSEALLQSILQREQNPVDVSRISWEKIAKEVIK